MNLGHRHDQIDGSDGDVAGRMWTPLDGNGDAVGPTRHGPTSVQNGASHLDGQPVNDRAAGVVDGAGIRYRLAGVAQSDRLESEMRLHSFLFPSPL